MLYYKGASMNEVGDFLSLLSLISSSLKMLIFELPSRVILMFISDSLSACETYNRSMLISKVIMISDA